MSFLTTVAYPFKKVASVFSGCFVVDRIMDSHPIGSSGSIEIRGKPATVE